MIKKDSTERSIELQWLMGDFNINILMTATPCSNRGTEFVGILHSIEPDLLRVLWRTSGASNAYSFEDDDPAAELRLSKALFEKHIRRAEEALQGKWLRKVWEERLIRRSHASKIKGEAIAKNLPVVQITRVAPTFTNQETTEYEKRIVQPRNNIIMKTKEGKLTYDHGKFRECQLITTWLTFSEPALLAFITSKTTAMG